MQIHFQKKNCQWATAEFRTLIRYTCTVGFAYLPLSEQPPFSEREPQLNLMFVGSEEMRKLNRETRGVDRVTDILSFPMLDCFDGTFRAQPGPQDWDPETGDVILGDLVLCLDRAEEQAETYGHSIQREVSFLCLHGLLHLLGYDHELDEERAKRMEGLQSFLLEQLEIPRSASSESVYRTVHRRMQEWNRVQLCLDDADSSDNWEEVEEDGLMDRSEDFATEVQSLAPDSSSFHSGFVSLVGRPNAGKSTLINRISGQKLAIVTRKAQTTRHNIRAIYNDSRSQIVFTDTPGLHRAQSRLGNYMQDSAWRALRDCDLLLLLVDALKWRVTEMEESILKRASDIQLPVIVLLTKVDQADKGKLLPAMEAYHNLPGVSVVLPISARTGEGMDDLLQLLYERLPEGPQYYDSDAFTDQSERQLCAELIREQILLYTHEEVPHGTAVQIDSFEECADPNAKSEYDRSLVRIHASILCEKSSHKGILIGKAGQSLKRIGKAARMRMEALLDCQVYLELHVKVREDWRNRNAILQDLGYRHQD